VILAITLKKNSHFGHFYQDFGHKLRKKSGNPAAVGYAVGRRTIVVNPSDSHSKYFCKAGDSESICRATTELSIRISQQSVFIRLDSFELHCFKTQG